MATDDLSRLHLERAIHLALASMAGDAGLHPPALGDLSRRATASGDFSLHRDGSLATRTGEALRDWAVRTMTEAPHYAARPSVSEPKVLRHTPEGRRRSASELLDLANGGSQ